VADTELHRIFDGCGGVLERLGQGEGEVDLARSDAHAKTQVPATLDELGNCL
jgi:hypothetical protein